MGEKFAVYIYKYISTYTVKETWQRQIRFFGHREIWSPGNLVPKKLGPPRNLVPKETWSIKKLSSLKPWSPRNFGSKKYGPKETQGTFDLIAILWWPISKYILAVFSGGTIYGIYLKGAGAGVSPSVSSPSSWATCLLGRAWTTFG